MLADCAAEEADAKRRELQQLADRAPVDLGPVRLRLRLSAGCATFPADGDDYQSLLARADHRMYQDKSMRRLRPGSADAAARARHGSPTRPDPVGTRDVA